MSLSNDQVEFVRSSRFARSASYLFAIALVVSGLIFKSQPENGSALASMGFIIASFAVASGACYAIYLAAGSMRSGQFPASHAHVPMNCKVTRGYKAKIYSGIMTLAGIFLAFFAALIVRFAFAG